jgi:hypothetical protein
MVKKWQVSNIDCHIDKLMDEAAIPIFSYALRPQVTEGDCPQVVAERGGKFLCILKGAEEQNFSLLQSVL